ncbi:class I SAM-dependent methyltransferase [Paenibacillus xylanilyticus]|uniref:Class I SAM-dependent methyltransferase n=1 Tax=Paenibacillus xylanilyticus TaxID=248903 RepID=A0A7Y6C2L5_9BACL|nr:class I SAM-dependent methyltransferase [Paenibacillus xylanilyticus]NUU79356.1 class I SAM-dependent methyltransferase [Paenibacillus xylanilyticus]
MKPSVKHLFDKVAQDYDMQRKQLIPCFNDFYGMALDLMECSKDNPRILDLGAGTGLLSGMLLQKYPNARITLMDISEKMLEMARRRFADTDQVQYVVGDYTKHAFTSSYDMIISSLSIHHLTHADKKNVFGTVYKMLEPGGLFINADQVQGRTPMTDAYYRHRWLDAIHKSGLSDEAISASIERRKVDINAKLEDQLLWLEEAGFSVADCMYKYLDFVVFYAQK